MRLLFIVPKLSGGGAEKVIASLASEFSHENETWLVTTMKEDGVKGYALDPQVKYLNLPQWKKEHQLPGAGTKNRSAYQVMLAKPWEEASIPERAFRVARSNVLKLRKNAANSFWQIYRRFRKRTDRWTGQYRDRAFQAQADTLKALKQELGIDCAVSFLNSANYMNVLSACGERTVISIRSCLEGAYAPADVRTEDGRRRLLYACQHADCIVPVSFETADYLKEEFGSGLPVHPIQNYCDVKRIETLAELPVDDAAFMNRIQTAAFVFFTAGRLTDKKGQWHMIRAFREVRKTHPGAVLMILGREGKGDENTADLLRQCIRQNHLENNVYLLGFHDNPYQYLRYADAYLMTSFNEGFPNALTEAMALGIPVISTDCRSGPREILAPHTDSRIKTVAPDYAEYGILVPECSGYRLVAKPCEEQEMILAEAMCRIMEDENLRKKYSEKSRERAEMFSPETILEQWRIVIKGES